MSDQKKVKKVDEGSYDFFDDSFGYIHLNRRPNNKQESQNSQSGDGATCIAGQQLSQITSGVKKSTVRVPMNDADRVAINDFSRSMCEIVNQIKTVNEYGDLTADPIKLKGERVISPKLLGVANNFANVVSKFAEAVASSSSDFFTAAYKNEMRELRESMRQMDENGDIRNLRFLFTNFNAFATMSKLPNIEPGVLTSYKDWVKFRDLYSFDKYFDAQMDTSNSRNSLYTSRVDSREGVDVTLSYYLSILPITPALINTLRALNVSDEYLTPLGNWRVNKDLTSDEDRKFDHSTFINDSNMFKAGVNAFHDYSGPDFYAPIIEDLLSFIKSFVHKATWVRANGNSSASGNAYTKYNLFNPDLAIKIWMMTALNAVYKVMVEDGLGAPQRFNDSVSRSLANYNPVSLPDLAALLLDTAYSPFDVLSKSASEAYSMLGSGIPFNQKVYTFVKERFAPIITEFKVGAAARFISNNEVPVSPLKCTIVPELVLPINPYDKQVEWYESNANGVISLPTTGENGTEVSGRSVYFKVGEFENIELDKRSGKLKPTSIYHFDNMLSYAFWVISNNDYYNVHSAGWHVWVEAGKESNSNFQLSAQLNNDLRTTVPSALIKYPDGDIEAGGPWITKKVTTAVGDHCDSVLSFDMHCSFVDRDVIMQYTGRQEFIHPISGKVVTESGSDNDQTGEGLAYRLAIKHTNPVCLRMAATIGWFANHTGFMGNHMVRRQKWTSFNEYVVKESGLASSLWASATTLSAPRFSAKAADVGDLRPQDFFRYSFMIDKANQFGFIDNTTAYKFSALPQYTKAAGSDAFELSGVYLLNMHNAQTIDESAINDSIPNYDGSIFAFGGHYMWSECLRVKQAVCCKSGSFDLSNLTTDVTVTDALKSGFFAEPGNYIRIKKPVLKSPYSFDSDGRPRFAARSGEVNTFSTRIDVCSFRAWQYQVSDSAIKFNGPSKSNPATLASLIAGSRQNINDGVKIWRDAINNYLRDNCNIDRANREQYYTPTFIAISHILQNFSAAPGVSSAFEAEVYDIDLDAARAAGQELMICTRFSTSATYVLVTGTASGNASDLDAMVLDGNAFCAAHGFGALTSACEYSSDKITLDIMKFLGMPMMSQRVTTDAVYTTKLIHDVNVAVSTYLFDLPKRRDVYKSPNKDIVLYNAQRMLQFKDFT